MPVPTSELQNILWIVNQIYTNVKLVSANKAQCMRLYHRISIVIENVKSLDVNSKKPHYVSGLHQLENTLRECLDYICQFSSKNKVIRFVFAERHADQFTLLAERLMQDVQTLQLGINIQHIVNSEEDKQDLDTDIAELKQHQAEILEAARAQQASLVEIQLGQEEQQRLMAEYFSAFSHQLQRLSTHNSHKKTSNSDMREVSYFDLIFVRKIANGNFTTVYEGRWHGAKVAIKALDNAMVPADIQKLKREAVIMQRLQHPAIAQFYGICLEATRVCLVTEYFEHQSLSNVLKSADTFLTFTEEIDIANRLCQGLSYLHAQGILHRDLRSTNVLIDAFGRAKLSDFGLAKIDALNVFTIIPNHRGNDIQQRQYYLAPELLSSDQQATASSDVYSLGTVLWELFTRKSLPEGGSVDAKLLMEGQRLPIPASVPIAIHRIISNCWAKEASMRAKAIDLLERFSELQICRYSKEADKIYISAETENQAKRYLNAYPLYCQAAELGHMKAMAQQAYFLLTGRGGVRMNKVKALELFSEAAYAGVASAQYNAAQMLEYGDGVTQDLLESKRFYQQAARQGYEGAETKLIRLTDKLTQMRGASAVSILTPGVT